MTSAARDTAAGAHAPAHAKPAPHIAMQPVKSTNVTALGYDEPTKTLEVHFKAGGRYRYTGVSKDSFTAFMQADSKGAYFARHIRGLHEGTKLGEPPRTA